jgi:hypothetical protein
MPGPEHAPQSVERGEKPRDIERAPEVLDRKAEVSPESHEDHEKNIEKARDEVNKEAISGREVSGGEDKPKGEDSPAPRYRSRKESYNHTMQSVRNEMSAPERAFSKVIHNPVVERASEVVGSTVARPNAILSGSLFAGLATLILYLTARHYGFELRGAETIITFVLGWAAGILFDILRGMFTGKRQ